MRFAKHGSIVLVAAFALGLASAPALASGGMGGGSMSGGGMSSTPQASSDDPAHAYQAGIAALQAHNYQEAIRNLRIARRAAPNDGVVNYVLGLAYVGNNNKNDARDALQHSVHAPNAPAEAYYELGLVLIDLGDHDGAVAQQASLQHAVSACDAACGDARRGQLQSALDRLTQAITTASAPAQAPAANPATTGWNFPTIEEGRQAYAEAVGDINRAQYVEALDALRHAQAAVGPHPDILNYMGFASRKLGRFDDAFTYYRAALAIDPNHLGANEYLGELYLQLGDVAHARTQLARLDQLCVYGCAQHEELSHWIQLASN